MRSVRVEFLKIYSTKIFLRKTHQFVLYEGHFWLVEWKLEAFAPPVWRRFPVGDIADKRRHFDSLDVRQVNFAQAVHNWTAVSLSLFQVTLYLYVVNNRILCLIIDTVKTLCSIFVFDEERLGSATHPSQNHKRLCAYFRTIYQKGVFVNMAFEV